MKTVQIYKDTVSRTYRKKWGDRSQELETRITANIKLHLVHEDTPQARKLLEVDLEGSHVHPDHDGKLMYNDDDDRGWYTESVECTMWNDEQHPVLAHQAPDTTTTGATVTSDNSYDFGADVSKDGPSAGISHSVGSSFSTDLTDFICLDTSYAVYARHQYKLARSSGAAYNRPRDLIDFSVGDQDLYDVPHLAKTNLPILDQAIWSADGDYQGTYNLNIRVHHAVCYVHLDDGAFHWTAKYRHQGHEVLHKVPVNWGRV